MYIWIYDILKSHPAAKCKYIVWLIELIFEILAAAERTALGTSRTASKNSRRQGNTYTCMFMYVYKYFYHTYILICIYIFVCICIFAFVRANITSRTACKDPWRQGNAYTCTFMYVYKYSYIYIYLNMYLCICLYIYIFAFVRAHITCCTACTDTRWQGNTYTCIFMYVYKYSYI